VKVRVSEKLLSLIRDLRKTIAVLWAEDYHSAYKQLENIRAKYSDILYNASMLREEIKRIEKEERDAIRKEWGAERILENLESFKEEIRKRVHERILREIKYSREDMLAIPLLRYIDTLYEKISKFMKSDFSNKIPRTLEVKNCIFTVRRVYGRVYEVKGYWVVETVGVPKLSTRQFLENYQLHIKETLLEVKDKFRIRPEILDENIQSDEKSKITGGSLLVVDLPQVISLTFTVDNEKLYLKIEFMGKEKYKKVIAISKFAFIIAKSFIESLTF